MRLISFIREPELIGPPACPIIRRWTVLELRGWKLMLHHFPPDTEDHPLHDHPWRFWIFVVSGGYLDIGRCSDEWMPAGAFRHRPADHAHRTKTGRCGAWTVVLAAPKSRRWGFWRGGRWFSLDDYLRHFAFRTGCDAEAEE